MTIPLSYNEVQLLCQSGALTKWAPPFLENLKAVLDTQGWWEAFDTAELSDFEIEALVNHAFLCEVKEAMGWYLRMGTSSGAEDPMATEIHLRIHGAHAASNDRYGRALQSIRQKIAACEGVSPVEFRQRAEATEAAMNLAAEQSLKNMKSTEVTLTPEEHDRFLAEYRKPALDVFGHPPTCTSLDGEWGCVDQAPQKNLLDTLLGEQDGSLS